MRKLSGYLSAGADATGAGRAADGGGEYSREPWTRQSHHATPSWFFRLVVGFEPLAIVEGNHGAHNQATKSNHQLEAEVRNRGQGGQVLAPVG